MQRSGIRDPISTPARRRRLAAEFTRKIVRDYFMKACKNVSYQRLQYNASRTIQMAFRRHQARSILQRFVF
jgi:hypothetical protein